MNAITEARGLLTKAAELMRQRGASPEPHHPAQGEEIPYGDADGRLHAIGAIRMAALGRAPTEDDPFSSAEECAMAMLRGRSMYKLTEWHGVQWRTAVAAGQDPTEVIADAMDQASIERRRA